jgi:hypothetical protein
MLEREKKGKNNRLMNETQVAKHLLLLFRPCLKVLGQKFRKKKHILYLNWRHKHCMQQFHPL